MNMQKTKCAVSFAVSILIVFLIIIFLGILCAVGMKYVANWSFSIAGVWISCIGFLVFGWSWASPTPIVGWGSIGIDMHPEKNEIISHENYKNYPIWKQPNRLKQVVAIAILFLGGLLQALGQTFEI